MSEERQPDEAPVLIVDEPFGQYVTEISVPSFDDGRRALYSPGLSEPELGS
jgi:hypothetical protein